MTTNQISIELVTNGTWIKLPRFDFSVQVEEVEFDGQYYNLTVIDQDWRYVGENSWRELVCICAGETVEASDDAPVLRDAKHVTFEEWQAKADAQMEALDRSLVAVVADALSVPAMAAE
ncbi:hypothetical protein [Devosia lacusdianchii]|uniref:hypothetical protein n=1 Tax=Devosia lacusdianchii TaxID=2917991 RepID=UPI001F06B968|nr:hypothetical protein [Devosia sp. JXJ CY 41]